MHLLLHDLAMTYLPHNRRQNAKGWITFNAPCCHHRGHNKDTKGRGNFLLSPDGSMVANCYNCKFKARYVGGDLNHNFEKWLQYLNVPTEKIQEAKLEILSKKLNGELETIEPTFAHLLATFPAVELPQNSKLITDPSIDITDENYLKCTEYLYSRGRAIYENYDFYWSSIREHNFKNRIIIPFMHHNKIIGWSARYAGKPPYKNIPKYYNSDIPAGYMFNCDVLEKRNRKYVVIVEGPLDAISIDCVASLGSTMSKQQIDLLNSYDCLKIVLPDREKQNQELIDIALSQNWYVSFPEWEEKIKDAADATKKYGKLYSISSIIAAKTNSELEINIKRRML